MKKTAPQLILSEHFQQVIKASVSGRRLTLSGKRISKGTIVNYCYVLRLVNEFENKYKTKIRIQLLHRASMSTLQKEKNYWIRFFTQFSAFLYKENNYGDNYVSNVFKILKTFFNYLQKEKAYVVGNYHRSFKRGKAYAAKSELYAIVLGFSWHVFLMARLGDRDLTTQLSSLFNCNSIELFKYNSRNSEKVFAIFL